MKKQTVTLLIILITFITQSLNANHIIGGDISTQWVSSNNYIVKVRLYKDCSIGTAPMPNTITLGIYDKLTNNIYDTLIIPLQVINPLTLCPFISTGAYCIEEGVFSKTCVIADNPNGYYLQTQFFARNALILNITNQTSSGMTIYAEMPDPAIGQNSSPDFGSYPSTAYLLTNIRMQLQFNITDPDGDSLVYSLVEPLNANTQGTSPAPYSALSWAPGFSLSNICGGSPPMDIDNQTGVVSAQPTIQGLFIFVIRAEEYRNGIKIGETRRDIHMFSFYDPFLASSITDTACNSYIAPDSTIYNSSGQYIAIIPSFGGCDSIIEINLVINNIDTSITNTNSTFTSNDQGATYQWLDCNNSYAPISGETGQSFIATSNGNYAVSITKNGCVDTSGCYNISNVGLFENINTDEVNFYPNPTNDLITLDINGYNSSVSTQVFDLSGKLLQTTNSTTISLKDYAKGIYVFRVAYGDKLVQVKVVRD